MIYQTEFKVPPHLLKAFKLVNEESDQPAFLFIHGAGKSEKSKTLYLAKKLIEQNICSLSFDHSGHGESSGELKESSLKERYQQACAAMDLLSKDTPLSVCGSSMGGHIAMRLLKDYEIENLILFCPAAYDKDAFNIPFNQGFSDIIRQKDSWKNSDLFELLSNFTGNLLLFIGEDDEVIPPGVIDLIDQSCQKCKSKKIIKIKNCPHKMHNWLQENEEERNEVTKTILEIL